MQTATTTGRPATVRRNKDGQMNLKDLSRVLAASRNMIHRQGGNWIMRQWSDAHGAFIETPAPYWYAERQAIQWTLGLDVESRDEASQWARR